MCERLNKNYYDFVIVAAVVTAFGFVFAKLLYLLTAFPVSKFFLVFGLMITHPIKSGLMSSGFVFYGGLLGGVLGYCAGVKIARCSFSDFVNIFAFVIPYIHAWGRVGCFCAGCCYGIPYDGPLAVHYTHPVSDAPCGPGIFPVQLLEALLLFIFAFWVLLMLLRHAQLVSAPASRHAQLVSVPAPRHAQLVSASASRHAELVSASLFLYYTLYYSLVRFGLEYLRHDKSRGFFWIFSTSQWISIFIFLISVIIVVVNFFQRRRNNVKGDSETSSE